jgi:hypothetical protein
MRKVQLATLAGNADLICGVQFSINQADEIFFKTS